MKFCVNYVKDISQKKGGCSLLSANRRRNRKFFVFYSGFPINVG